MATITTLTGMKNYIKRKLGNPVVTVEIDDSQYDDIVDDTVQIFQDLHTGDGNYMDFLGFTISAGVSAYSTSGMNLAATLDLNLTVGTDGINTLFSPSHQLLYRDWVVHGGYPGNNGGASSRFSGMVLSSYEVAMQYLNDINDTFSIMYHTQYSDARQEILLYPTPATGGTGLLQVYKKETAANLYNNRLVKRLAVAEAKIQWGTNLSKYQMNLPHGGTINGAEILAQGKEEKEKVMEDIVGESEPIPPYME